MTRSDWFHGLDGHQFKSGDAARWNADDFGRFRATLLAASRNQSTPSPKPPPPCTKVHGGAGSLLCRAATEVRPFSSSWLFWKRKINLKKKKLGETRYN